MVKARAPHGRIDRSAAAEAARAGPASGRDGSSKAALPGAGEGARSGAGGAVRAVP